MIRRIALTLCAGVALAGAACLPETASRNAPDASTDNSTVPVAAHGARSGYIVASS